MTAKSTDWRPGPTVCRCCLSDGCYKDISTEYFWMGKREVYAEMLSETLSLTIAYSQSGGPNSNSRLICEACIARLRDASDFRRQVLECEKTFMHHLDPGSSTAALDLEVPLVETLGGGDVKLEVVKLEKQLSDDDDFGDTEFLDDDDDDLDDQPLMNLATKIPKKESVDLMDLLDNAKVTEKRKSSTKTKTSPSKKPKIVKREVKPTPSKAQPKPEKKKKETDLLPHITAKRNAEIILEYTTVYPFRYNGKVIICVYCCEEITDPATFRRHVDEEHETFTISTAFNHIAIKDYLKVDCFDLKCRLCLTPFETIDEAADHLLKEHDVKNLDLNFDIGMQPYKLIQDRWNCYICDKKLPTLTKLCRHTTSHYTQYTCDICGRNYLTLESLKYHIRCSHSGKHVCRKCWKDFPSNEEKKHHIKVSRKCWPNMCTYCSERFSSWENKEKHLVDVHGCPKTTYPCPDCDKVFDKRKLFYYHYKLSHTDEALICSCCGMKFPSKKTLEDHRIGHTGEKMYQCSVCSKSFTRNKSLTQHMWTHSEVKRFVCVLCKKQFAQKVSLKGHMKSHHPEINAQF